MSAVEFYLSKGYTPSAKSVVLSGTDTASVWAPVTGKRVILTNMGISSIGAATTIVFFFEAEDKFAEFSVNASASIFPYIGAIESTMVSGNVFAKLSASATDGCRINLQGFEVD